MVNNNDENVVDLVFKQKIEQQAKIKKIKAKRKRRKITIFLLVLIAGYLYWSTDVSKPKIISISNNYVLSKDEVIEQVDIDLDTMMLFANPLLIKHRLLKHPLIENVKVNWSLIDRNININIDEIDVFAYRQNVESATMLMFDGSHIQLSTDYYKFLPSLIFIEGFEAENLEKRLLESFLTLDSDVIGQISEIHQTSVSYDDNFIELRMNDGNKVYTSFQTVDRVNYYFDIVSNLKAANTCIIIDEMSGEAYSQPCDVVEDGEE